MSWVVPWMVLWVCGGFVWVWGGWVMRIKKNKKYFNEVVKKK